MALFDFTKVKQDWQAGDKAAAGVFSVMDILEAACAELVVGSREDSFSSVSIDSRSVKEGGIFIALKGERFDGHDFVPEAIRNGARCVVVVKDKAVALGSKIPCNIIAVKDTLSALTGLAYFHRKRFDIPVVCITGSNGKTTTKEMLSLALEARYNVLKNEGNNNNAIGLSLAVLSLRREHGIAVLELGTNHFGEIKELARIAAPSVGIITNIGPAHLEFFKDVNGVMKEKWELIEELGSPRIGIINSDDELLDLRLQRGSDNDDAVLFSFGIDNKADFMARGIRLRRNKLHFLIKNKPIELRTASRANVYNALAAYAAARIFSADAYDIINAFRRAEFPKARFQMKTVRGFKVIDDAYNANPESFRLALQAFASLRTAGKRVLVMGDMLELGQEKEDLHRKLGRMLSASRIDIVVALGPLSHIACDAAEAAGFDPRRIYRCVSHKEARQAIFNAARKRDTILLKGSRGMKMEEVLGE